MFQWLFGRREISTLFLIKAKIKKIDKHYDNKDVFFEDIKIIKATNNSNARRIYETYVTNIMPSLKGLGFFYVITEYVYFNELLSQEAIDRYKSL